MPPAVSMSWLISWSTVSFAREKLSSIAMPHGCRRIVSGQTLAQLVAQSKHGVAAVPQQHHLKHAVNKRLQSARTYSSILRFMPPAAAFYTKTTIIKEHSGHAR